ncbi:MAG: hypothetical protein IJ693_01185 [Bacteroidaceae bacterium]|nr:hypothetical protein [Bacteroidaceae bacterium]
MRALTALCHTAYKAEAIAACGIIGYAEIKVRFYSALFAAFFPYIR